MINHKPEVLAFWEKYKDAETEEEWGIMIDELARFKEPQCIALAVRCIDAIEKRYKEKEQGVRKWCMEGDKPCQ